MSELNENRHKEKNEKIIIDKELGFYIILETTGRVHWSGYGPIVCLTHIDVDIYTSSGITYSRTYEDCYDIKYDESCIFKRRPVFTQKISNATVINKSKRELKRLIKLGMFNKFKTFSNGVFK